MALVPFLFCFLVLFLRLGAYALGSAPPVQNSELGHGRTSLEAPEVRQ